MELFRQRNEPDCRRHRRRHRVMGRGQANMCQVGNQAVGKAAFCRWEPVLTRWGQRDSRVMGPDGLSLGQQHAHMSPLAEFMEK